MRLRSASLCVLALLALLVAAPSANAQKNCPGGGSNQPPGNSEVDQYGEDVPGPCGDEPIGPPDGGDPDAVPPSTADELDSLGADGDAAALLAQATAPGNGGTGSGGGPAGGAGAGASDIPAAQGDSLFDEVFDALTGSADATDDGLGLLLPLILLGTVIAAVIYGVRRRTAGD